ncbi:MAG: hypothetical protein EZS28_036492 [Streblomastix strix]|uniref:Uncharacterized protein n=1 Tax=Streblomastix strix TaxID=222440 RepID=A0A5J4UDH3_9EUKA|nr:MAG: hypothetical protein EZS28_036492 [Streblomastix strix]
MKTLQQFGRVISTEKCEAEPKQIITFLGWIKNLEEMNIRILEERQLKMIRALKNWCNTIYKNKYVKIRQLAALIGRLNFLRTQIKEASLYLMELDKAKTQALKQQIMGRDNDSKQNNSSPQRGSNADIRQSNRINTTRLLGRNISRNDKQRQGNQSCLLQATPFRANLQEDAKSSSFDTFRQHNSSPLYWEMETERISDRKNKTRILPSEKTLTANHNNSHPSKIELNDRLTLQNVQIRRLYTEGLNDLNDLQDIESHATDRHFRNTVQQTNQQLCDSGPQRFKDTLPQRVQLQIGQSQIVNQSTNTRIKQGITNNEIRQSTGINNSTDLAGTIMVHQTKKYIHQIPFPWIIRENSGDGTENERQGLKACSKQCRCLASGPVADVGRDMLMRCMKMRGFSKDEVNILFKIQ